jgi:hypothetical protein
MLRIDSKVKFWILVLSAAIVPGSGYVITGKSVRGLLMLMWMFIFAFITYHLTDSSIPFLVRFSGGFVVWILTVIEAWKAGKRALREKTR